MLDFVQLLYKLAKFFISCHLVQDIFNNVVFFLHYVIITSTAKNSILEALFIKYLLLLVEMVISSSVFRNSCSHLILFPSE